MKKHFRLFSIFLVIILSFSFLSVNSFAADEENLIDSDLRNWEVLTGDCDIFQPGSRPDYYCISLGDSPQVAIVYDLADLNLSDSYLLSFFLLDSGVVEAFFNNYTVTVGVIVFDSSGDYITDSNQAFFTIDSSNYSNFTTNPFELSFKMNSFVGKPAICFSFNPTSDFIEDSYPDTLYIKNISLFSSSSETNGKLDGILGWLQELWDSITEGFSNLGLSITHLGDRLQIKLGEVITNLSAAFSSVGDRIQNKLGEVITNLSAAFSSVGDRIQNKLGEVITGLTGELRFLGDRIINYLLYFDDEVPENPFEGVDSPLDDVQGFFDDLIDYLSNIGDDIETVIDSITGPVTLLDHFTKRFEWLFGIVTFTLMLIVVSRFIGL